MSTTTRFRALFLGLVALLAARPLAAQMDPRLQGTVSDLLDVYKVAPAKPELLTVYDFSGSMHAVYWNGAYYTGPGQTDHSAQWDNMFGGTGGDFPGIVPAFDANGYIYMLEGSGYVDSSGVGNIWNETQASQFQKVSNKPTAQLVKPDGTLIVINHLLLYSQSSLMAFVQQASHLRVTATANVVLGGISRSVTRTIDLPIPWEIMDNTSFTAANPIPPLQIPDPLGNGGAGGPSTTADTLYKTPVNVVNNPDGGNFDKIGRFHYNKDFLWWVFFGTDIRNSTNNGSNNSGKFVIPAVSADTVAGLSSTAYEPTAPLPAFGIPNAYPAFTWQNGLANMARFQALKHATLIAWFANQNKVWWGARYLDGSEEGLNTVNTNNGNASSPNPDRNINLFRPANNSSSLDQSIPKFTAFAPVSSTPLTYAFANAYAQLALRKDPSSSFGTSSGGGQSGTENPIPPCRKSFVVVFTDGIANDAYAYDSNGNLAQSAIGGYDPYQRTSAGVATLTEALGNTAVNGYGTSKLNPSANGQLSPGGPSLFNIWTLAGIAAHYSPAQATALTSATSYPITSAMPFRITDRGATVAAPRKIRTMTIGMSLAGSLTDATSGKSDLFRAALYGNPDAKTWNLGVAPYDPTDPNSDPTVNPFFFDATDTSKLSSAMSAVLAEVTAGSASVAAPASPLVGLSLGSQAYLGLFQTVNGPRWKGDLLMTGLYVGAQGVSFVDDLGHPVTNVDDQNAIWSANLNIFNNASRTWKTRNIYTNIPGTTTVVKFDESNTTNITAAVVGAPDAVTRLAYIRFMRGAETAAEVSPAGDSDLTPRNDIMGDIVNSAPTVLEYPISTLTSAISSKLVTVLGTVPASSTPHFRVIFSGDNQGIFHAFGEVSWTTPGTIPFTTTNPVTLVTTTVNVAAEIAHGDVDELWAFIPGEFLKNISQLRFKTNPHRYMVDGNPTVYFNDVPASGQVRGNGVVDGSDVVRVIMGLRKGGRSYYAFDFSNLANVVANTGAIMPWKLVPDDIPNSAVGSNNVMRHMGFSTSTPQVGRVDTNAATNQDLVFLGGGLSTSVVDTAFKSDATFLDPLAKLGRSIVAFDVVTGPTKNLYTWNFNDSGFAGTYLSGAAMGCVPSGVQPLEFFPGSGHTQRVYFADTPTDGNVSATLPRGGGIWALGNTALAANNVIRLDSSNIDTWTLGTTNNTTKAIRHIFQAPTGWSITTTPTPFLLNNPYPAVRTVVPKTAPVAVGVSFGTGDRNDPVDNDTINPLVTSAPKDNYLNVIFDRQDSASLSGVSGVATSNLDTVGIQQGTTSLSGDVADLTTVSAFTGTFNGYSVNPSDPAYYLLQKVGYKLNLNPAGTHLANGAGYFYPKTITNTVVLNGVLFFSDFFPSSGSSNACQGTGLTNTYRICNVLQPTFNSGNVTANPTVFNAPDPNCSGVVLTYPNLPGEITALGTSAVIQSGQGSANGQPGTIDNAGAKVGGSFGKTSGIGFKPRSWRIIR